FVLGVDRFFLLVRECLPFLRFRRWGGALIDQQYELHCFLLISWPYHDDESQRRNVTVRRTAIYERRSRLLALRPPSWSAKGAGIRQAARAALNTRPTNIHRFWTARTQRLPLILAPVGRGRSGCPRCL